MPGARPQASDARREQAAKELRRFYARGTLDENRCEQVEKLGMVWSRDHVAWEEGLAAARGRAAEHGHLLAPLDATYNPLPASFARHTIDTDRTHYNRLCLHG